MPSRRESSACLQPLASRRALIFSAINCTASSHK
nr:MAG TPA_asm: hypothetical protein [Caudoviricetes sp.]